MKVIRSRPEANYTQILNRVIRDKRLDAMTLGVLVRMLSNQDGWTTTADGMWQQARRDRPGVGRGEGQRAYRAAFAALETCGYLERQKLRSKTGLFETCLILHDEPVDNSAEPTDVALTDVAVAVPRFPPAQTPHPPRSDRRCANGTSVSGTSSKRPSTKTTEKTMVFDRSPDGAADAAAARGAILCDVRTALTRAYGAADSGALDDGLCLDLWEYLAPETGRVGRRVPYLMKIFGETPDIGTLISKAYAAAEPAEAGVSYPGDGSADAFAEFYHLGVVAVDTLNRVEEMISLGADHDRILGMISFAKAVG